MNESKSQLFARSTLALVLVAGGSACDSGLKQIGSLDDGVGATETNDGNEPGDGDPGEGEGETGEACMGDGDAIECAESQGVEYRWNFMGGPDPDGLWICAANVEPLVDDDGYRITLTHCSDSQGQPQADASLALIGDGPEPELADGDQPLTEFRVIIRNGPEFDYTAIWAILRPIGEDRISVLGFAGTKLGIDPSDLGPLALAPADIGCEPENVMCSSGPGQTARIGLEVSYGCAQGIVADGTMLSGLGLEQGADTVYDVFVNMAKTEQCNSQSRNLLEFVIVGRTP